MPQVSSHHSVQLSSSLPEEIYWNAVLHGIQTHPILIMIELIRAFCQLQDALK